MSETTVSPELIAIYIEDARAHLEALDHCLLSLEREGLDGDTVAAVLGPLHTLKGNSGMIGFSAIKDYVHRLEDVFARVNEGTLKLEARVFDVLFAGASALREAVELACQTGREERTLTSEMAALASLTEGLGDRRAQARRATPVAVPAAPVAPASHAPAITPAPEAPLPETRRAVDPN